MTSIRRSETYDFWGELMVLMHDDPYLWRVNEERADWVESLDFGGGLRILDLGCGNGFLDIVLARRGHVVTGVDMLGTVIEGARGRVEDEPVSFTTSDLREIDYPEGSFDLVLMFGLVGLMSVDDDASLLRRARQWLAPGGRLLVESDLNLAADETAFTDHPDGRVHWKWSSDEATRLNTLVPELHRADGVVIELRHPIDPARDDHIGLIRYLYPPDELSHMVETAGFTVTRIGHFLEYVFPDANPDRYMLLGIN